MNRYVRLSEYMWLMLSITCIGFTVYEFAFLKNTEHGFYALGITLIAGMMYGMRRVFRKRVEKMRKENEGKN